MLSGTLIRGQGGIYTARGDEGELFTLRAKKKFRRQRLTPLVGDRILLTPGQGGDEHGWIEEILPRSSAFVRPPVANVTALCIVIAPQPAPDFLLVDRMLVCVRKAGIQALIIINKRDMDETLRDNALSQYKDAQARVLAVSAKNGAGTEELRHALEGQTVCFCGQSGVGKSTLINALTGIDAQTGEISRKIARGKNTTRHVELFYAGGLTLMDTPGFSLFTLSETQELEDPVLLQDFYPELSPFRGRCRFEPCYHDREPGCLARQAVLDGALNRERYQRYVDLLNEQREAWRKRYD